MYRGHHPYTLKMSFMTLKIGLTTSPTSKTWKGGFGGNIVNRRGKYGSTTF
jgi:hypothetical protein